MRSGFVFGIAATIIAAVSAAGAAAGGFTDVTAQAGLVYQQNDGNGPCAFPIFTGCLTGGVAVGDYDNDGWEDLLVGRHHAPMILYRNHGDGTFTEDAVARGVALDFLGRQVMGQGTAWGDVNGDGFIDLVVSEWAFEPSTVPPEYLELFRLYYDYDEAKPSGNRLFLNLGDGSRQLTLACLSLYGERRLHQ